jgi:hypothetical protein
VRNPKIHQFFQADVSVRLAVAGRDRSLFFGTARESDAVIDITPGDRFELIARQTSASTKNIAAHELTWDAHI